MRFRQFCSLANLGLLSTRLLLIGDLLKVRFVLRVDVLTVPENSETSCLRAIEIFNFRDSLSDLVNMDAVKHNIEQNSSNQTGFKSAVGWCAIAAFIE